MDNIAVIVLAAGKGTRMKSHLPKVLHPVAGQPMLWHVLSATQSLKPNRTVVVTGYGAEDVEDWCTKAFPGTEYIRQTEQNGTGHAVMQVKPLLKDHTGPIVIVYGDIMLSAREDVLPTLMQHHAENTHGFTLLTANVANPTGLGRIFKNKGHLVNVEEKDCTAEQKAITTVNPAIHAVHGPLLWQLLAQVKNDNAQKEFYLTDIIGLAAQSGARVIAAEVPAERAELGMNNRAEIAEMEELWQHRKRTQMMLAGVTLTAPHTVWFSADTEIAPDTTIGQNVVFGPGVMVEEGATILPFCHLEGCTVQKGAIVGPFARIRPTTVIGPKAKVGNFVEIKNTTLGNGSKANHLTYLGDTTVGDDVNLGACTVTANYSKKTGKKSRTVIGSHSSTGAGTLLVAPVTMAEHSYTGAGTTLREDTEPASLTTTTVQNKVKKNYSR